MVKERARHCAVSTDQGPIEIAFRVQRRRGMRHLRVVVDESNQVVLKVPHGVAERQAVEFLKSQGDWIVKIMRSAPPPVMLEEYLRDHPHLSAAGRSIDLEIRASRASARCHWDLEAGQCTMGLNVEHAIEPQLIQCLRTFAKATIPLRVEQIARKHGLRIDRVTVRDQRTRWGSCSARRAISLNWRLVLLPPELHDYIILHELAHLTHLNHSRRFWDLLQEYDAESRRHDKEVTYHSRILMRLGRG